MYTITVTNLVLTGLTLAQLDTFLQAGIAAVPGAELTNATITITQTSQTASTPSASPSAAS